HRNKPVTTGFFHAYQPKHCFGAVSVVNRKKCPFLLLLFRCFGCFTPGQCLVCVLARRSLQGASHWGWRRTGVGSSPKATWLPPGWPQWAQTCAPSSGPPSATETPKQSPSLLDFSDFATETSESACFGCGISEVPISSHLFRCFGCESAFWGRKRPHRSSKGRRGYSFQFSPGSNLTCLGTMLE